MTTARGQVRAFRWGRRICQAPVSIIPTAAASTPAIAAIAQAFARKAWQA